MNRPPSRNEKPPDRPIPRSVECIGRMVKASAARCAVPALLTDRRVFPRRAAAYLLAASTAMWAAIGVLLA